MTTIYKYAEQIKDEYGNFINKWGAYENTITFNGSTKKPINKIKLIAQFDSLDEALKCLENEGN